jgi:ferredoxin-type protein NapH
VLWILLGGRTFCSWVCPYHLVAEWAESLHLKLAETRLGRRTSSSIAGCARSFYLIFALLALATGYTVFETISPTGIPAGR